MVNWIPVKVLENPVSLWSNNFPLLMVNFLNAALDAF
jgi:hypothetical protein